MHKDIVLIIYYNIAIVDTHFGLNVMGVNYKIRLIKQWYISETSEIALIYVLRLPEC